ncbi:23S rRNA pseudouridine(1911/1915/1917) synthase RluD [Simiduia sp. 21SJ11W-1]|uniref:23S rRNA pseudouridine(1911/1915/1917) synthase RluD n=1 Tax=Simiduia sp. 21SJ11W-1 TaxID=2909669 RepID=UPI00209DB4B4|nr:23S rRNA pseudouridine(1911/1915/1917) synthase RluD [Simiduia sp. 21SJ11W-1]UTA48848.1 23S rRNA pseudouridine(1911/1915/1917) synthase RluD [Simiduia sp. 21SJ11W-1]
MSTDSHQIQLEARVPLTAGGSRVDALASELFPDFSRSRLQGWIKSGALRLDGNSCKPKDKCFGGETLTLNATLEAAGVWAPQAMDLDIVYEDEHLLVLNKPANLVVHPGAGNADGTLLNALLHHCPGLQNIPRAGIVHRLDKDTTGLMVVAKTLQAQTDLVAQLQARTVKREYDALALGRMIAGGRVEQPIGRHPTQRTKMAVVDNGKEAITHYSIQKRFLHYTLVRCQLATGRTHQIRVHMAWLKHPLVGDQTYAGGRQLAAGLSKELRETLLAFPRQALHAAQLGLIHPAIGEPMQWHAPRPADFDALLARLKEEDSLGQ